MFDMSQSCSSITKNPCAVGTVTSDMLGGLEDKLLPRHTYAQVDRVFVHVVVVITILIIPLFSGYYYYYERLLLLKMSGNAGVMGEIGDNKKMQ